MEVCKDILSEELFAAIREYGRKTKLVRTNVTQWNASVIGWSTPIICIPLKKGLTKRCRDELGPHVAKEYRGLNWHASIHLGSRLSTIPWHSDDNHKVNITIYMNDSWHADWAGYFLYQHFDEECNEEQIRAIIPQRNLGLVYETPLMHTVALPSINAPLRESLQIFINDKESDER